MEENVRLKWPDRIKGFSMLLVIIWHMNYKIPGLNSIFSPFFMPVFFFVSGYFFKKTNFIVFIKKRTRSLVIPFFLYGIIISFIYSDLLLNIYEGLSLRNTIISFIINKSGEHDILWFVSCLIVAEFIFWGVLSLFHEKDILFFGTSLALTILGVVVSRFIRLPWHIEVALGVQIFLWMGYFYKKNEVIIRSFIFQHKIVIVLLYAGILVCDRVFLKQTYDLHLSRYGDFQLNYFVLAGLGIMVCLIVEQYLPKFRVLEFVGQNTLVFYAFQYTGIVLFDVIVNALGIDLSENMNLIVFWPLSFAFCVLFCLLIAYIKKVFGRVWSRNNICI